MIKNFLLFCLSFRIQVLVAQEAASQSDLSQKGSNPILAKKFNFFKFYKENSVAILHFFITVLIIVAIYVMLSINAKVGAFNQDMNAIAKAAEIFSQDVTELKNDMKVTKDVVVAEIQNLDNAMLDLGQKLLDLSEKLSAKVDENLVELKNALKAVALDIKLTKDVAVDEVKKLDDAVLNLGQKLLDLSEKLSAKVDEEVFELKESFEEIAKTVKNAGDDFAVISGQIDQIDVSRINTVLTTASFASFDISTTLKQANTLLNYLNNRFCRQVPEELKIDYSHQMVVWIAFCEMKRYQELDAQKKLAEVAKNENRRKAIAVRSEK